MNTLTNEAERNAKRFYQSCMDAKKTRKTLGKQSLLDIMYKIVSGKVVGKKTSDRWNFQKSIQTAHNVIDLEAFFHWNVVPDSSSRYVIKVATFNSCVYAVRGLLIAFIFHCHLDWTKRIFVTFGRLHKWQKRRKFAFNFAKGPYLHEIKYVIASNVTYFLGSKNVVQRCIWWGPFMERWEI